MQDLKDDPRAEPFAPVLAQMFGVLLVMIGSLWFAAEVAGMLGMMAVLLADIGGILIIAGVLSEARR